MLQEALRGAWHRGLELKAVTISESSFDVPKRQVFLLTAIDGVDALPQVRAEILTQMMDAIPIPF